MLNKTLYDRLMEIFGDVGITNEDSHADLAYKYPPTLSGSIKVQWDIVEGTSGEWYTVRCPFCHDRSRHLNISYLSFSAPSIPGYQTEGRGLIANCFHGCLKDHPERVLQLANLIQVRGTTYLKIEKVQKQETPTELSEDLSISGIRTWCPEYVPIAEGTVLPDIIDTYIKDRGWTKKQLELYRAGFGAVYSYSSGTAINNGSLMLIFPFAQRNKLKGFQARAPYSKEECEEKNFLRWYTHPGLKKTVVLYNLDNAAKYPFVCISEGVTDVLQIGPYGVGTMGTSPSKYQKQLLAANWSDGAAFFLPDMTAIHNADGTVTWPKDLAQAVVDEANEKHYFKYGAYVVQLKGDDPGSLTQAQIWEEICCQTNNLPQFIMSKESR